MGLLDRLKSNSRPSENGPAPSRPATAASPKPAQAASPAPATAAAAPRPNLPGRPPLRPTPAKPMESAPATPAASGEPGVIVTQKGGVTIETKELGGGDENVRITGSDEKEVARELDLLYLESVSRASKIRQLENGKYTATAEIRSPLRFRVSH